MEQSALDAVRTGDINRLREIIEQEPCLVQRAVGETTLLIEAVIAGNIQAVNLLIDAGADVDQGSAHLVTPLCAAAARGHLDVASLLLKRGCDITKVADDRPLHLVTTSLHYAIITRNLPMMRLLLQHGHDPNYPSNHHNYPIVEAIRSDSPAVVQLLLDCPNCHLNYIGKYYGGWDFPPLHQAIFRYRKYDVVQLMLDSGRCNLSFMSESYLSILIRHAYDRSYMILKLAKLLLQAGCDMQCRDRYNYQPFETMLNAHAEIFSISLLRAIMELLVLAGVRPSQLDATAMAQHIKDDTEHAVWDGLARSAHNPRPLVDACRRTCRQHLGIFPNKKLKTLPLPPALIQYLTLENLKSFY